MSRPLGLVAFGIGLVALDFRVDAIDLLADPAGWLLVALGGRQLGAVTSSGIAAVAAVLSLGEAWLPFQYLPVTSTGEIDTACAPGACNELLFYDDVGRVQALAIAGAAVIGSAAVVRVLRAVRVRSGDRGDGATLRRQIGVLEAAVPLLWALPYAVIAGSAVLSDDDYDPVWNGGLELVGLAGVVTLSWAAVVLGLFAYDSSRSLDLS